MNISSKKFLALVPGLPCFCSSVALIHTSKKRMENREGQLSCDMDTRWI